MNWTHKLIPTTWHTPWCCMEVIELWTHLYWIVQCTPSQNPARMIPSGSKPRMDLKVFPCGVRLVGRFHLMFRLALFFKRKMKLPAARFWYFGLISKMSYFNWIPYTYGRHVQWSTQRMLTLYETIIAVHLAIFNICNPLSSSAPQRINTVCAF